MSFVYFYRALFKINHAGSSYIEHTESIFARITDIREFYDTQDFSRKYADFFYLILTNVI